MPSNAPARFATTDSIRVQDLPPQVVRQASAPPAETLRGSLPIGQTLDEYIREQERRYIEETIKFNGGSREKAAKMLGISMATLTASSR